jgi:quercetin dioxygenase-like cupin family protein
MNKQIVANVGVVWLVASVAFLAGGQPQGVTPSRGAAAAGQAAEPGKNATVLTSKAFPWDELEVREQATGKLRPMFRSRTATLEELEMHATVLNPGQRPHPPHRHPYEEMLVLREGQLEATVNERVIPLSAGSVLFIAPNDMHGWQNTGTSPATYYIITWRTERTGGR